MEKRNILPTLPGTTERENRIIQECMRETQRRAIQRLRELKTEPTIGNLEGFYGRTKEQETERTSGMMADSGTYRHWRCEIKEVGLDRPIVSEMHGVYNESDCVKYWGLKNQDVEWYKLTEI